jgi:type III pantothenate kinase
VWLLDLGNTRLKIALGDAAGIGPVHAFAHADADAEDGLAALLKTRPEVRSACLASVADEARTAGVVALLNRAGVAVSVAHTQPQCAGLEIAYADPARLGVDRFLALLATRQRGGDWLLVSFGSAITVDLLDADGRHHGGLIGMAESHQREALAARFPALNRGSGEAASGFANDTPDAVASGAYRQALGLVLAAWGDACATLGHAPGLLLCGGDAARFAPDLSARLGLIAEAADGVVLEGLRVYARVAEATLRG